MINTKRLAKKSRADLVLGLDDQLERVAEAGMSDVTRVAAQRTVSVIEATKAEVLERRNGLKFINTRKFAKIPFYKF